MMGTPAECDHDIYRQAGDALRIFHGQSEWLDHDAVSGLVAKSIAWLDQPHRISLERAFFEGYGTDPREPELWALLSLREAVGTAVWAYQVGDTSFERPGRRMIEEALELF
ncbi:hypothetical protein ABH922_003894 [Rhodococcus sp. 27YEA15]|uniref:hypothetical protein n=1 Tax=Rhodococcus sp. 27YEA15 TaxID=3156259 RepID=UPI003C7C8448